MGQCKAELWTVNWTMDWVATHFCHPFPSHSLALHHWQWSLACDFTGKPATPLALWHYVTRQFKLRVLDKISATKPKQNNQLTKPKQQHSNQVLWQSHLISIIFFIVNLVSSHNYPLVYIIGGRSFCEVRGELATDTSATHACLLQLKQQWTLINRRPLLLVIQH